MLDIIAAVIIGNAVCLIYVYMLWRGTQLAKQGQASSDLPAWLLCLGIIPGALIMLSVIY